MRKKKSSAIVSRIFVKDEDAKPDPVIGAFVVGVNVDDSARLITVGTSHPVWSDSKRLPSIRGEFIRICPPADATDEQVEALVRALRKSGASVKLMSRPAQASAEVRSAVTATDLRSVVATLVDGWKGDRDALKVEVESVMGGQGV